VTDHFGKEKILFCFELIPLDWIELLKCKDKMSETSDNLKTLPLKDARSNKLSEFQKEELTNFAKKTIFATLLGVVFGGLKGGQKGIEIAKNAVAAAKEIEPNLTSGRAKSLINTIVSQTMMKESLSFGWRVGLFVGIFSGISVGLNLLRDKKSPFHTLIAATTTGCLFGYAKGSRGMIYGAGLGTSLGMIISASEFGLSFIPSKDVPSINNQPTKVEKSDQKLEEDIKHQKKRVKELLELFM